jgi:hypothetical protein
LTPTELPADGCGRGTGRDAGSNNVTMIEGDAEDRQSEKCTKKFNGMGGLHDLKDYLIVSIYSFSSIDIMPPDKKSFESIKKKLNPKNHLDGSFLKLIEKLKLIQKNKLFIFKKLFPSIDRKSIDAIEKTL